MSTTFELIEHSDLSLVIDESSSRYDLELNYNICEGECDTIILEKGLTLERLQSLYKLFDDTSEFIVLNNEWVICTAITRKESTWLEFDISDIGKSNNIIIPVLFNKHKALKTLTHLIEDHFNSDISLIK